MTAPVPTLPQTIGLLAMSRGQPSTVLSPMSRRIMLRHRWIISDGLGGLRVTDAGSRALAASPHLARAQREVDRGTPTAQKLVLSINPAAKTREYRRRARIAQAAINNRYSVQVSVVETELGAITHLWIRAHDGTMPRSWRDLQRIKDDLVGAERVAVEVFPPTSELVDSANMAHLWVYPPGHVLPFGLRR